MKIRSVTLFVPPSNHVPATFAPFAALARDSFHIPVRTVRLATHPFPTWLSWAGGPDTALRDWFMAWEAAGFDYVSLGPVRLEDDATWIERVPALLAAAEGLFASAQVADRNGRISLQRARDIAHAVRALSEQQANGFGNLYFTATANCRPGSPFFPVAYHTAAEAHFALAVESADVARAAAADASTPAAAGRAITAAVEAATQRLTAEASRLAEASGIRFSGIDFSLAPFPTDDVSLGGALETVAGTAVGGAGTLFAAGLVADALQRAAFPRCGFNGLMLPVLEDSVLAARAADGRLSLNDLLLYSSVCGVGLDTIPLPGDVSADELAAIYLDVAALAVRADKQLTARLMPLPGLAAGEPARFDFPYFADSRVMVVPGTGTAATGDDVTLRAYGA